MGERQWMKGWREGTERERGRGLTEGKRSKEQGMERMMIEVLAHRRSDPVLGS